MWGNLTIKEGWGGVNPSYTATYTNNRRVGFDYDAAGNLLHDGQQTYSYDATGQQATASGTALSQSYDGDGVRVRKVESGATTYYLRSSVLGKQVVAEINGNGTFQRGYVYLGGQMLAVQESNQVSWVHQDPITKGHRLTNRRGGVDSWVEFDPWGGKASGSTTSQRPPHRYTTYERDANGGDEAMRRRYESRWQRFAQPDPYDGSYNLTDPQSFNRYSYVQNDPVNFVDPTGLERKICGTYEDGSPVYCDEVERVYTRARYIHDPRLDHLGAAYGLTPYDNFGVNFGWRDRPRRPTDPDNYSSGLNNVCGVLGAFASTGEYTNALPNGNWKDNYGNWRPKTTTGNQYIGGKNAAIGRAKYWSKAGKILSGVGVITNRPVA